MLLHGLAWLLCVVSDEALLGFDAVQYMKGFDACAREVTDCLQSRNITGSQQLHAGLLGHLASCRRRLMLARSRDHQHALELTPAESLRLCTDCPDENAPNCVPYSKITENIRAAAGEQTRSPLLSIDNVQPATLSAADSIKASIHLDVTHRCSIEQAITCKDRNGLQSDTNCSDCTESHMSRDVMHDTDYEDVLSLATEDDVASLMWRPW